MKKVVVITLIIAAIIVGITILRKKKQPNRQFYVPITVSRGAIQETIETTGKVEPLNRVEATSLVAGRVDKIFVEEGASVKQGQLLAYLSSTDRVAILDAARAKGGEVMAKWEKTYKPTPILSPLNGTVIKRNVVEGQTIATSYVMFALSDDLIVVAQVDESDIGRIKVGQRALITLDAFPNKKIEGNVFQISREGVNTSNVITYDVKIRPTRVPDYFQSEMSANIEVIIKRKSSVLCLPMTAVMESDDGVRYVYKGDPNHPEREPITVGIDNGKNVEILSGVNEGETVFFTDQNYKPQMISSDANPFMPSGPKKNKSGKSSGMPPPPM
ncbi:MAG: efflux RND transporter periplasmic adaptor subunit [Elusimicrobia bacterium]|nr:efflux RND transporter periplasmic adaptor subunit [Candidatus Obscuribacterium magneticum]